MEDMAIQLLHPHDTPPIGTHWAHSFEQCQPELQMCFLCKYSYFDMSKLFKLCHAIVVPSHNKSSTTGYNITTVLSVAGQAHSYFWPVYVDPCSIMPIYLYKYTILIQSTFNHQKLSLESIYAYLFPIL